MQAVTMPPLAEFTRAREIVREVAVRTPLVALPGAEGVWLKPETLQPSGSFKLRGVFHAVARMEAARRARGVGTVSAGNTAKALAFSARRFGVAARSLMPENAPRAKIEAFERLGGTAVLVPRAELFRYLDERLYEREAWAFVHPWTDRDVLLGHGSMAFEILEDRPDVETVFLPVGGGGLLGGVGSALRALAPQVRIVGVEPAGCPSFHAARAAGKRVDVPCDTICDGVAVPYITDEMLPLLSALVDDVVLVSEEQVKAAMRALVERSHLVAEGAGALAVAAALALPAGERGRCVCPVTGGSLDTAKLVAVLGDGAEH